MTFALLTTSDGKKMGKTMGGAVWLDPEKTSPYDFYQYWRNVDDSDVLKCLRMLTFIPLEEIDKMSGYEGAQLNEAKDLLAYELTKLVHSEEEAEKARTISKGLFAGGGDIENMPSTCVGEADLTDGVIRITDLLLLCKLTSSRGEARRLIDQKGIEVDGQKVTSIDASWNAESLSGKGIVIKKGKKIYHRAYMA